MTWTTGDMPPNLAAFFEAIPFPYHLCAPTEHVSKWDLAADLARNVAPFADTVPLMPDDLKEPFLDWLRQLQAARLECSEGTEGEDGPKITEVEDGAPSAVGAGLGEFALDLVMYESLTLAVGVGALYALSRTNDFVKNAAISATRLASLALMFADGSNITHATGLPGFGLGMATAAGISTVFTMTAASVLVYNGMSMTAATRLAQASSQVLVAPVVEEVYMRGPGLAWEASLAHSTEKAAALLRLTQEDHTAVVLNALYFASMHVDNQFPVIQLIVGYGCKMMAIKYGLAGSIALHMVHNALAVSCLEAIIPPMNVQTGPFRNNRGVFDIFQDGYGGLRRAMRERLPAVSSDMDDVV